ncbi:MAG TPA: hypothetical protein ENI86_11835 [Acidimicrobiales bacterium]|nr:hypothetical protein [Acidimicrobiales bacterium]
MRDCDTTLDREPRSRRSQDGIAMITVILGVMVIFASILVLSREAVAEYRAAKYGERDDVLFSQMEGVAQRYLSKMATDPAYYLHWVDEFERPRTCTDPASPNLNQVRSAGSAWLADCGSWAYLTPATASDWTRYPLTTGDDDGEVLMEVRPRGDQGAVELIVAGQIRLRSQYRTISVEVAPPAVSAFEWMSEVDLRFAPGAVVAGPVYSGRNVDFAGPPSGTAEGNVYADGAITGSPILASGVKSFDSTGTQTGLIDSVFPEQLVFDDFWDDIDLIRESACNQGGLCLAVAGANAYLVQPHTVGSVAKVAVWYSTTSNVAGCIEAREWWWSNPEAAANSWQVLGDFDVPANGIVWADSTVILGNRTVGAPTGPVEVAAPLTIAAGDANLLADVVVNADIDYRDPTVGDVLGVIASGDIVVNPAAAGQQISGQMSLKGAYLAQAGQMRVARSCGQWGSLPTGSTPNLLFNGSIATRNSGDLVSYFPNRSFDWDHRLGDIAPPLFPRVSSGFTFVDFREIPVPDWARS